MNKRPTRIFLLALPLILAAAGCGGGGESFPTIETLSARCSALKGRVIAGVTITGTKRLPAVSGVNPAPICHVMGTRVPFLDVEVDVPDNWSGRVLHQGGEGLDGTIPTALTTDASGAITAINEAITRGRAVYVGSNGGNRARTAQAAPEVWTQDTASSRDSIADYAHKAVGTSIGFAKSVAREVHRREPTHTYFIGCSNGGRNAYSAAELYAAEYDGIVSGCMTMNMAGQTAAWLKLGSKLGTAAAPSQAQFRAAFMAATTACDANDGVTDGVIANPAACQFSPASLVCGVPGANPDPALCLTSAQADTMQAMLTDVVLANGTTVYSRYTWADFSFLASYFGYFGGAYAFLATNDASWMTPAKQQGFDLERDYPAFATGLQARKIDQDKAAVAAYIASGRKLISWHGGADNLLSVSDHDRNFRNVTGIASRLGVPDPRSSARFFVVPGASHTRGATANQVDWFAAIVEWVENGNAPRQLEYKFTSGTTSRSMPVCEHPKYPRYDGQGDRNLAGSYTCTSPS